MNSTNNLKLSIDPIQRMDKIIYLTFDYDTDCQYQKVYIIRIHVCGSENLEVNNVFKKIDLEY